MLLLAGLLIGQPAGPSLAGGVARLQSGDAAGAAKILESVTKREPKNGRAWRNLGIAYVRMKEPDRAIAALQQALHVQPEMAGPLYDIAIAYATKKDADRVFDWLRKAKATRKIDMTQAEQAADLAPFRSQALRFHESIRRTGQNYPRVRRRSGRRPVRLDRAPDRRRRWRRHARLCHLGAYQECRRRECRPCLCLFQ
jgi:tetratricopeptide (TPR) repeat protein